MTYTEEQRHQIVTLKRAKVRWAVIASTMKLPEGSLRMWWSKNRKELDLPPKDKIAKTLTSGRTGLQIKRIASEQPRIPIRDYPAELEKVCKPGTRIPTKSTIHRFLKENELITIRLLKRPLVSDRNRAKRVHFASQYLERLDELMRLTVWSDETTVRKMPKGREIYFRCHSSVDKENLPFNHQIQQGGFSVMFWGCFSSLGLGPLVALEGSQNRFTYIETLRQYLLPQLEIARSDFGLDMTFMQDNAPCHKAKLVRDFLEENEVPTLDWPPQSPDMNPIENIWNIVKNRRQKKFGFPATKEELIEQIFEIWEEIDISLIESLNRSIKNRLEEVLRLQGRATRY